jgi:hypothetical protein
MTYTEEEEEDEEEEDSPSSSDISEWVKRKWSAVTMIVYTGKLDDQKGCLKCVTSAVQEEQYQSPLNLLLYGEIRG